MQAFATDPQAFATDLQALATDPQALATDPQALANTLETPANELQTTVNLPAAPGNQAQRGNEISGNVDSGNIIQGSRTQRSAYTTALQQTDKLIGYYALFNAAVKAEGITKLLHQDALLSALKS